MKPILFNFEQVIELAKKYQQMHKSEDMDEYAIGVSVGIEFVLFLMERCED